MVFLDLRSYLILVSSLLHIKNLSSTMQFQVSSLDVHF
nr:unnamed protein product [Callosobruchus chinensis]